AELVHRLLRERTEIRDDQGPRLAEQRRRREILELAPLPLGGVDLGDAAVVCELEGRSPEEERVLAPEQDDGRRRSGHRSADTTGPRSVTVTSIVPCWSVRQICAPTPSSSASAFGSGWPYGFGWPTEITAIWGSSAWMNSGKDVSPPWCGTRSTSMSGTL